MVRPRPDARGGAGARQYRARPDRHRARALPVCRRRGRARLSARRRRLPQPAAGRAAERRFRRDDRAAIPLRGVRRAVLAGDDGVDGCRPRRDRRRGGGAGGLSPAPQRRLADPARRRHRRKPSPRPGRARRAVDVHRRNVRAARRRHRDRPRPAAPGVGRHRRPRARRGDARPPAFRLDAVGRTARPPQRASRLSPRRDAVSPARLSGPRMVSARFRRLAVADVRRETADCVSIAFAVPPRAAPVFRFQPGQYLTLRARFGGKELRRCYSICDDRELRIAVKRVPGGVFSTWATEALAPGDAVEVLPPAGGFTLALDPAAQRVVVALACGSGITPVMALLKSVLAGEPGSRFHLIYGNRTSRDIIFAEELARLKDRHLDRLSVTHVLSREAQDVPILAGRLDAARIAALLPAGRIDEALLCGPVAMMDAAAAVLAGRGVAAAHI